MPECIVCKGYYKVDQSCKEAEQLRQEVEQRRKEVEQLRQEAGQRRKEAEQRCKEAEQCRQEAGQRCKEVEQRRKEAEQRREEAEQRCKEAEQHRKEAGQSAKEAEQRYEEHEEAEQCRKETGQSGEIVLWIRRVLAGIAGQCCKIASMVRQVLARMAERRYEKAEQRRKKAEQHRKMATRRCRKAEQRYRETEQHCNAATRRCEHAEQCYWETEQHRREAERRCEDAEHCCERCGSDNNAWENWRRSEPVEQGGLRGVLAFTEPHFHIPLLVAALSTLFGLLAAFTLWVNIKPGFRAVALLVTPAGCLLSLQGMYEARMQIRQREMLRQVRRGWRKGGSAQMVTLLLPAVAVGAVLLLTLALVKIDVLWELVKWLALVHAVETGDSLPEKFIAVLPFISLVGYVMLAISFTASSSLMLARRYINRLNEFLQHPIFLQDEKLAEIVRQEAEIELGRLSPEETNVSLMRYMQFRGPGDSQRLIPSVVGGGPLSPLLELWGQTATWVWDELARTDDGGIEMKVARQEIYQLPKPTDNSEHRPHPRVRYVVRADPWGRVIEIKRDGANRK